MISNKEHIERRIKAVDRLRRSSETSTTSDNQLRLEDVRSNDNRGSQRLVHAVSDRCRTSGGRPPCTYTLWASPPTTTAATPDASTLNERCIASVTGVVRARS